MAEIKIRQLLTDPIKEEICLDELIKELTRCGKPLSLLETKNTGDALRNAKKALAEFKKNFNAFEARIKGQITQEVQLTISRRDKSKIIGNPTKLPNYRPKT